MNVKRFFVAFGTPLLLTTLIASFFNFSAMPYLFGIAVAVFLSIFSFIDKKFYKVLGIAFIISIYALIAYNYKVTSQVIPISNLNERTGVVEAKVDEIIKEGNSNSYILKVVKHNFVGVPREFLVKAYSFHNLNINCYDSVKLTLKFQRIENTSSFNLSNLYKADNIYTQAYITGDSVEIVPCAAKPIRYYLTALNKYLSEQIDIKIGGLQGQLVKSMLLGDKQNFDQELSYSLAKSGIIHITAVSGLHVTIISGAILLLLRLFKLNCKLSAIISIIFVWLFVLFSGFSYSAIRAGIMFSVVQMATIFRKSGDSLNALFLAGTIIVLLNPFAVLDAGFLLTFSCTFGIVCVPKIIRDSLSKRQYLVTMPKQNKFVKSISSMLIMSFSVMLCSLPALFTISKGISLLTPLINLIAIPLTTIIVILAVFLSITFLFSNAIVTSIASLLISGLKFFTNIIIYISNAVSNVDGFYIGLDYRATGVVIIGICICFLIAFIFYKQAYKNLTILFAVLLMILPVTNNLINFNKAEVTSFSTYEGGYLVSICSNTSNVFLLSTDAYTSSTVAKFLDGKNISKIDNLIILDNNVNAINDVEMLVSTKKVMKKFINGDNPLASLELNDGFSVLPIDETFKVDKNIRVINGESVVTSQNGVIFLLTGDLNTATTVESNYTFYSEAMLNKEDIKYPASKVFSLLCNGDHSDNIVCAKDSTVKFLINQDSSAKISLH